MNTNWKITEIGNSKGILEGTINNHQCNPKEDCPECEGDGKCVECSGSGNVNCHVCNGSGHCRNCDGQGKEMCTECGGNGRCRHCGGSGKIFCDKCHGEGTVSNPYDAGPSRVKCSKCGGAGYKPCPTCSSTTQKLGRFALGTSAKACGSGKCQVCDGTGRVTCKTCRGTGKCTSCNGTGKETCSHCHGDKNCPNCSGTGKVTCRRCEGSGWYQTYHEYDAKSYKKQWHYISSESLEAGIYKASKRPVYKDVYRQWRYKNEVEFDKIEDVRNITEQSFGTSETFQKFEKSYEQALKALPATDTPFKKHLEIVCVPVTKIDFSLNNNNYTAYVMGDNSVVMCGNLPKKVEIYKPTFFQKIKLSFTKGKRLRAYIKLAAYIFQCDGKNYNESRVLKAFMSQLKENSEKLSKFKEQLTTYNSHMPYETFRKEISSLFSSKKTLTFAWQCMSVDKELSPEETELFEKITKEYKLKASEIESLKKYANKYSLLNDESIVKEYMGS